MTFGNWDANIHSTVDQVTRMNSGFEIKTNKIVSVNSDTKTAIIAGSAGEPYNVSLESCECEDFKRHKAPCKHMYRLAFELGCFGYPDTNVESAKDFNSTVPDKIKELESLYLAGTISGKKYVAIAKALKTK